MQGGTIRSARLALGGVAPKPWRSEKAEAMMTGKPATEATYRAAANEAVAGAKTYEHNAFKVEMAKETIVRAFMIAARNGEQV
jgi:xanthine dehydrogenase YagS FAD-binding subunit